jgi:hypothetical protein
MNEPALPHIVHASALPKQKEMGRDAMYNHVNEAVLISFLKSLPKKPAKYRLTNGKDVIPA